VLQELSLKVFNNKYHNPKTHIHKIKAYRRNALHKPTVGNRKLRASCSSWNIHWTNRTIKNSPTQNNTITGYGSFYLKYRETEISHTEGASLLRVAKNSTKQFNFFASSGPEVANVR
jgi:hypothetical protein